MEKCSSYAMDITLAIKIAKTTAAVAADEGIGTGNQLARNSSDVSVPS
jgi:hypothetical protein